MKKFLRVGALFLATISFSGPAFAAGYGDAGCGLGSMVFGDEAGAVQILAATTNLLGGNQTLGITTGTSNCNREGLVELEKEREVFAQQNYSSLVKEMAMGRGENLETLAGLFGCSHKVRADFGSLAQEKFENIVKNEKTSSNEMLTRLNSELAGHDVLSKACAGVTG